MTDVHSAEARSRNMAAIRGKDTKPEMTIRRALHAKGFRYRLHNRELPGRPDLVFRKHKAVIFVHGCFFHGHKCRTFRWPASNVDFWRAKIGSNWKRDLRVLAVLRQAGWRTAVVWECAVRATGGPTIAATELALIQWLRSKEPSLEIGEHGPVNQIERVPRSRNR